jgi:3-deoxy-D-arabino-heptulosonate 7-phosphate (DAHP) synthase
MSKLPTLREFLQSDIRNSYIQHHDLELYVRRGWRFIEGRRMTTLDIANVANTRRSDNLKINDQAGRTGQWQLLDQAAKSLVVEFGLDGIYIENVFNEFLPSKLLRDGYRLVSEQGMTPCFYWPATMTNQGDAET